MLEENIGEGSHDIRVGKSFFLPLLFLFLKKKINRKILPSN